MTNEQENKISEIESEIDTIQISIENHKKFLLTLEDDRQEIIELSRKTGEDYPLVLCEFDTRINNFRTELEGLNTKCLYYKEKFKLLNKIAELSSKGEI